MSRVISFCRLLSSTDIFVDQQSPDDGDISDDEDAESVESLDYISSISPPDKERDESYKPDIWNRI